LPAKYRSGHYVSKVKFPSDATDSTLLYISILSIYPNHVPPANPFKYASLPSLPLDPNEGK
ncbi:unnamed protein product, partial [Sphenostylis stenocarpa]